MGELDGAEEGRRAGRSLILFSSVNYRFDKKLPLGCSAWFHLGGAGADLSVFLAFLSLG